MPKIKKIKNDLLNSIIDSIKDIKGDSIVSLNFSEIENSICEPELLVLLF